MSVNDQCRSRAESMIVRTVVVINEGGAPSEPNGFVAIGGVVTSKAGTPPTSCTVQPCWKVVMGYS